MSPRLSYKRHNSYNTRSNKFVKVTTPGGNLSSIHVNKVSNFQICVEPHCNAKISGIPKVSQSKFRNLSKVKRSVKRAYGGNLCCKCLKNRIVRGFLLEEVKIVKKIMKQH